MFLVLLRFTEHKEEAAHCMAAHNAWIQRGFDDGVFVLMGGLQPKAGGALLAINTTLVALTARVNADPFVVEGIVSPQIIEIDPVRVDERLTLLKSS